MCRWQEEAQEHRQQLGSLRVAQERLEGRLRQEEEAKAIAEGEIARQKACIGSMRAEASELECALHRALTEVPFMLVFFFKHRNHRRPSLWIHCCPAADASRRKSLLVILCNASLFQTQLQTTRCTFTTHRCCRKAVLGCKSNLISETMPRQLMEVHTDIDVSTHSHQCHFRFICTLAIYPVIKRAHAECYLYAHYLILMY